MTEKAVLGGGCFWCTEAAFKQLKGVEKVTSGYAGSHKEDPTYREVCMGSTGHAEVVKVEYNPNKISYREILEFFFQIHNPTTKDQEGPDKGPQYRSIILHQKEEQKEIAEKFLEKAQEKYKEEIQTELKELDKFWKAEEKHQDYFEKNPFDSYCQMHARPKIDKAKEFF